MEFICKTCPECGKSMKGIDNVKHAIGHWVVKPNELYRLENEEARTRYQKLVAVKGEDKQEA